MAFFTSAFGDGLALHTIWWIGFIIVVTIVCYHLCKKRKAETAQNGLDVYKRQDEYNEFNTKVTDATGGKAVFDDEEDREYREEVLSLIHIW